MRLVLDRCIYWIAYSVAVFSGTQGQYQEAIYLLLLALLNKPKEASDAGE